MLPLDSPRWAELNHAYGDASDVPACLSAASAGDEKAVDELRGMICHQGSVYSASFAAIPHLVDIAKLTMALSTLAAPLEGLPAVYLMEAAAGLNGFSTLGRVLHDLADNEFVIECPSCSRDLYVWPDGDGLSTAAEGSRSRPVGAPHPRSPRPGAGLRP